ncbi:hypothetical protein MalM25_25910 [Planctomycetes bacterium MalM25]|nr:hypothetical protein MalM25_25910 [Planctomycetes bacterium MalM25]
MGKNLQTDLADLEHLLSAQAELVEEMVLASYRALHERSLDVAVEVLAKEPEINASEVNIEEHCLEVLALQQPVAIDLRRVAAMLKINSDLERIADLAVNVAERTKSLNEYPQVRVPEPLELMLERALGMLRDAHAAFLRVDADLARDVCCRDDEVDAINRDVIAGLVKEMESQPQDVAGYLHVFSVSRIIERIGDHATNIAEDVVYLAEGEITRHHTRTKRSRSEAAASPPRSRPPPGHRSPFCVSWLRGRDKGACRSDPNRVPALACTRIVQHDVPALPTRSLRKGMARPANRPLCAGAAPSHETSK